jgi:hypothetical protein
MGDEVVMRGLTFQPKNNSKGGLYFFMFIYDGHSIMAERNFYEI